MPTVVTVWTGRHCRALRLARRMSVRQFGEHIGVPARMVSKWESGDGSLRPRAINQAALDRSLALAPAEVHARFDALLGQPVRLDVVGLSSTARLLVRHPVDERPMVLVEPGPFTRPDGTNVWLMGYLIDMRPVSGTDFGKFVQVTGHHPWAETAMGDEPARVQWPDALGYAAWASKMLPTATQWHRSMSGEAGVIGLPGVSEWAADERTGRAVRLGRSGTSGLCAFRTITLACDIVRLLGI